MLTFAASLPPALTRRAFLRLIVEPAQRAARAIRHAFTSIEGTDLALLLYHFCGASPRFAAG